MHLTAVYNIPQINCLVIVSSAHSSLSRDSSYLQQHLDTMELFERILKQKDVSTNIKMPGTTILRLSMYEFLTLLDDQMSLESLEPSLEWGVHECMKMLTLNPVEFPSSYDHTFSSPKQLSYTQPEDIVEVFI